MALQWLGDMKEYHDNILETQGDPRVKDWPMMSSAFPNIVCCCTYVYIAKYLGPKLMEKRKPFQLKNVLIIYNAYLVYFSAWLVLHGYYGGWFNGYSFICQPCDYSNSPQALEMAQGAWWYWASKYIEFLDTLFFILRKKNNQISNLHVIHHTFMPLICWWGVKFSPGGHITFFGVLNSFVHVVMYSYYLLAALGPQVQKYLWWKKYLTSLQIAQFVIVFIHGIPILFMDCNVNKVYGYLIAFGAIMFIILFGNFYRESYLTGKQTKKQTAQEAMERMNFCVPNNVIENQPAVQKSQSMRSDVRKRVLPNA